MPTSSIDSTLTAALALCALPLAVGILGTLLAMGFFGRRLPGDRSNEVNDLHALLALREQELERLENAADVSGAQSQSLQAENARLAAQVAELTAAHAEASLRAEAAAAQAAALKTDLAGANATRRDLEAELRRRDDDVTALNSRLNEALDKLTAARAGNSQTGATKP